MPQIGKLVIVGVGLIGGSVALDLRLAGQVRQVVGVGRSPDNLAAALQRQIIDVACSDPAEAVRDADGVLLATPVGQMAAVLQRIAPHLPRHAWVTDAGSTKRDVAALYARYLPDHLPACVPGHPIAGSDLSGAAAARAGLYQQRNVILTPLPDTAPASLAAVQALWEACGAHVRVLTPLAHDAVFAGVSHLPHLLAFAYMDFLLARPDAADCLALAGGGFRDFTRIAGSHPEMWRDIALANRDCLLADLQAFRDQLGVLMHALESADGPALYRQFAAASAARSQWKMSD